MNYEEPGFPFGWEQVGGERPMEHLQSKPAVSPSRRAPESARAPHGAEAFPDTETQGVLRNEIHNARGPVLEEPFEVWLKSMKHVRTRHMKLLELYIGRSMAAPEEWVLVFCERLCGRMEPITAGIVRDEALAHHRVGIRRWPKRAPAGDRRGA